MFVQVCVLAGCDFIDSLPNVGFATAVKHIFNFRGAPAHLRVQRLVSKLSSSGTKIPSDFMQQFLKAETIFFHHIVFNPKKRSCEFLISEKHNNSFPDILERAKESLGIASPGDKDEVDLTSIAQQQDLHAAATSTKSFLGQIRSREVVEQIYQGEVCPRTLRNLSKSPTSSQTVQYSGGYRSSQRVVNHAAELPTLDGDGGRNGDSDEDQQGLSPTATRQAVKKSAPVMTAQQLENKKRAQAQERESSIQNLVNIYRKNAPPTAPSTNGEQRWMTLATRTRAAEGTAPSSADASSSSAHILSSTTTAVKVSKVTATSMKDLVMKHSQSVQASKSPEVQAAPTKTVPQSAPESRKRSRPAAKPAANSARKARTLTSKSGPSSGRKTLLDFFKQG
ncbi:hypothetical protein PHYSODRAFT_353392 [Phytophthora sojae]|uniref:Exonuclease 1 n=1 Tax=Phytophthora sojae (strain P6497) TaxID=1094619 RepID=G4YEI4_PHYSP|nr:hypothetical protein PHYSODRAFT_353392 [Phytophthora sojae]EGZ27261.1 hypothetical protein PHYSODRAFT_353392 [Phytophthora sojae]|eukprot:XP_009514536.1 hypothetical protein PHYSODRAFT_353392 [Phytophthora sojae]